MKQHKLLLHEFCDQLVAELLVIRVPVVYFAKGMDLPQIIRTIHTQFSFKGAHGSCFYFGCDTDRKGLKLVPGMVAVCVKTNRDIICEAYSLVHEYSHAMTVDQAKWDPTSKWIDMAHFEDVANRHSLKIMLGRLPHGLVKTILDQAEMSYREELKNYKNLAEFMENARKALEQ